MARADDRRGRRDLLHAFGEGDEAAREVVAGDLRADLIAAFVQGVAAARLQHREVVGKEVGLVVGADHDLRGAGREDVVGKGTFQEVDVLVRVDDAVVEVRRRRERGRFHELDAVEVRARVPAALVVRDRRGLLVGHVVVEDEGHHGAAARGDVAAGELDVESARSVRRSEAAGEEQVALEPVVVRAVRDVGLPVVSVGAVAATAHEGDALHHVVGAIGVGGGDVDAVDERRDCFAFVLGADDRGDVDVGRGEHVWIFHRAIEGGVVVAAAVEHRAVGTADRAAITAGPRRAAAGIAEGHGIVCAAAAPRHREQDGRCGAKESLHVRKSTWPWSCTQAGTRLVGCARSSATLAAHDRTTRSASQRQSHRHARGARVRSHGVRRVRSAHAGVHARLAWSHPGAERPREEPHAAASRSGDVDGHVRHVDEDLDGGRRRSQRHAAGRPASGSGSAAGGPVSWPRCTRRFS